MADEVVHGVAVGGVGRGGGDLVDQLGVGVNRQVRLVAVEVTVVGLVPVTFCQPPAQNLPRVSKRCWTTA